MDSSSIASNFIDCVKGTTANMYPVSFVMPLCWHRTLMSYSHADSQTLRRAYGLCAISGFFRHRFNLFAIKRGAPQS